MYMILVVSGRFVHLMGCLRAEGYGRESGKPNFNWLSMG